MVVLIDLVPAKCEVTFIEPFVAVGSVSLVPHLILELGVKKTGSTHKIYCVIVLSLTLRRIRGTATVMTKVQRIIPRGHVLKGIFGERY